MRALGSNAAANVTDPVAKYGSDLLTAGATRQAPEICPVWALVPRDPAIPAGEPATAPQGTAVTSYTPSGAMVRATERWI